MGNKDRKSFYFMISGYVEVSAENEAEARREFSLYLRRASQDVKTGDTYGGLVNMIPTIPETINVWSRIDAKIRKPKRKGGKK